MNKQNCSLIIATYNWPEALWLCLESVALQTCLPSEIIIADDGSTTETGQMIKKWQKENPIPLKHVWQEDNGFQLSKIRNKAIAACQTEYIIQIDGDLILHKDFIKDHLYIRQKHNFVTGGRVLLSTITTNALFNHQSIDIKTHSVKNKNFFNGLRIPTLQKFMSEKYKSSKKNRFYVKGCNMSFWKEDLLKVNGYNEAFVGWGREDSELAIRLINAGINKLFLKFGGISYHLYHKESSREMEAHNIILMKKTETNRITWAEKGLQQYVEQKG
jgi:glycosyltransferase involved in cell wall biosynthesis